MEKNRKVTLYNSLLLDVINGGALFWQGIRYLDQDVFLISGTTKPSPSTGQGIIYIGNISCTNGQIYNLNVPDSQGTSVYGPNYDKTNGIFNFVGSYTSSNGIKGFIFTGRYENFTNPLNYSYPSVNNIYEKVFIHSIMNNYLVGNAGNISISAPAGISFIYNINNVNNLIPISYPGAITTTTYGIWYNGDNMYTIVGGFTIVPKTINEIYPNCLPIPIGKNFIADYNASTNTFSNWISLKFTRDARVTHIEGISGFPDNPYLYSLAVDILSLETGVKTAYWALIHHHGPYNKILKLVNVNYRASAINSSNSVATNNIVGVSVSVITGTNVVYQAIIHPSKRNIHADDCDN
jgi:hypothetical protein